MKCTIQHFDLARKLKEAIVIMPSYEIGDESKIIRSMVSTRYGTRIRVIEVRVKFGGDFILTLYDGLEKPKLLKSIERPSDGDIILVDEIVEQELAYKLVPEYPGNIQERQFNASIVYEELAPRLPLGILTD